jgi:hypothetical protein
MSRHLALTTGLAILLAACSQPGTPEATLPASALAGAWAVTAIEHADGSVIDPAQPGLFVFTGHHYSAVHSTTAGPRPHSATPFAATDEEALAQFRSLIVNTGTYTVDGQTVTFRPMVARSPEFIGGEAAAEFAVDGDRLILRFRRIVNADGASAPDVGGSMTLRRVE